MMNMEQQLKAIKYSIMHLEGEIRALKHAQRTNVHDEIKDLLQVEIRTLEKDLDMFKCNRATYIAETKKERLANGR